MAIFSSESDQKLEKQEKDKLYTEAVNLYINDIYNFACYMLRDKDEADDIVQKTFLSFYNNQNKLDWDRPLKPWLIKVARNYCLDYLRKRKALLFSEVEDVVMNISDPLPDINSQIDLKVNVEEIKEAINNLSLTQKEVLLLKYFEDMTFDQISSSLEIPVNTAKSHFYRGKLALFKELSQINSINN